MRVVVVVVVVGGGGVSVPADHLRVVGSIAFRGREKKKTAPKRASGAE